MTTVTQGSQQTVSLTPDQLIKVSTAGEAYVDLVSGIPGSPYSSDRLKDNVTSRIYGPFGVDAKIRIRAITGNAEFKDAFEPKTALYLDESGTRVVNPETNEDAGIPVAQTDSSGNTSLVVGGGQVPLTTLAGLVVNDQSAASANRTKIQSALNKGGFVEINNAGVVWVDNPSTIFSNTHLKIGANTTIKLTGGAARNLFYNNAYKNPAFTPIDSITASGNFVTVTRTGHPFVAGQWIFVEGVGARGYNGCHRVFSVTANTYSYYSPIAPTNLSPSVYTGPSMTGLTWAMQSCPADVNITIEGNGALDWNGQNQTFPSNIETYCVILHRIFNPQVRNITGKNALKYMFCIGGSAGLRAKNIALDTLSDGFNVEMPCFNAEIEGVSGISGDDFVSILCGDTQQKTFTVGDGFNIVVRDIESQGQSSLAAIKIAGCAPFIFDEIHGENIGGTGRLSASVAIIDDLDMVGGSIGNVSFKNINRYIAGSSTNGEILQMRMTGVGGRIKVINATYNGTAGMGIRVDSVSSIDELDYEISCDKAVTGLPLVNIFGVVNRVHSKVNTGNLFAGYIGQTSTGSNVSAWYADGTWRGTTAAKGIYHSAGTISRIFYNGIDITNVRTLYESEPAASNDAELYFNEIFATGGIGLGLLRRGATIYADNIRVSGITQQMFVDSNNGFTVNAFFGSNISSAQNLFANGASNTINVRGLNLAIAPGFSATPTYTFDNGNLINVGQMTANITAMTFARIPPVGEIVRFTFTQDATAGRTIAWPATAIFPTAFTQAVITTDANKKTTVNFVSNGTQLVAQGGNVWS